MRHFDVQLMGGMVLHGGNIAEMVTGEGKTLVATLAAYLNALDGRGVHVVTVNDYLARRDAEWMSPLFRGLGMTVGAIQSEMDSAERQEMYACDITYGTNNEFGFDYLRDNMKPTKELQSQKELYYAIIDEVDSILIDEARTPLIISGPAFDDVRKYAEADRIARLLKRDVHFEVKEKERTCHLNDDGIREAEKIAGLESFYTPGNMEWPHLIDNSLKAHHLYKRDRDYVVKPDGEVVIVDEFTGRLMTGRQWSDGLHQAVEAKERVKIKEENQTLATITLQNFFKLYKKLSGMTGTAMTEATEFYKVYGLDVVAIPTNQSLVRVNYPDVIFRYEREKLQAILDEIHEVNATGRPILVGTTSIEKSEELAEMLKRYGIPHQVLNAKYHEREAEIVAQAGRRGAVTIATNMAGRGTDIILGGNPEFMAWADLKRLTDEDGRPLYPTRLEVPKEVWEQAVARYEPEMKAEGREVAAVGGLHIIGTERHESRRIDNQLRGRAGRQGDPGSSRFFLSLEDDLMRKFAGEWVSAVLTRLGMQEGEAIESKMVSRRIEGAQKKVEERNFDIRKNLLEYDEVMDEQRKRVYSFRQGLLEGSPAQGNDPRDDRRPDRRRRRAVPGRRLRRGQLRRMGRPAPGRRAHRPRLQGSKLRGRRGDRQDQGRTPAPRDDPPGDGGKPPRRRRSLGMDLASPGELGQCPLRSQPQGQRPQEIRPHRRRRVPVRPRGPRRVPEREGHRSLQKFDLSPAREFLLPDWGRRSLCGWVHHKFGLAIDPASWADLDRAEIVRRIQALARELYAQKEAELPARIALIKYLGDRSNHQNPRYDRDRPGRLGVRALPHRPSREEELRPLLRPEIEERLIDLAHQNYQGATAGRRARGQARGGQARRLAAPTRTDRRPIPRPWPTWPSGPSNP